MLVETSGGVLSNAPAQQPPLGIVIVAFNSEALLQPCLRALDEALASADLAARVVIVDNASSVAIPRCESEYASVEVIRLVQNVGFSPAVNIGAARLSDVDLLLVLNPDARLGVSALEKLISQFNDPAVAIAAPLLVDRFGRPLPSERPFHSLKTELHRQFLPFVGLSAPAGRRARRSGRARCVTGACLMVDRTFFAECEGFDETIRMYLEDVELCWQAHVRGRAVHFVSDARCYHEPGRSSDGKNFASDLALHLTLLAARVEFMRRRSGRLQAGLTRGVIAVGAVLRACAKIAQGRPCHKHLQVLKWAVTDGRAPGWLDGPRIAR